MKQVTDNSTAQFPKNCAVPSALANKEHLMNSVYAYYFYKCLRLTHMWKEIVFVMWGNH